MKSFLRNLLRNHPRLAALLFGGVFTLLLLVLAEGFFALLLAMSSGPGPDDFDLGAPSTTEGPPPVYDDRLGYKPPASAELRGIKKNQHGIIYDHTYHTDEFARRVTPHDESPARDQFAIFLGCSYTFGEGVEDDETLPARFAEFAPQYVPYNYGFRGYGPAHAHIQLDRGEIPEQVAEKTGVGFYTFINHHKERLFGSMQVTTTWGAANPVLEPRRGEIRFRGPFYRRRSGTHRFYKLLAKSHIVQYFGLNPPRFTETHDQFMAEVLADCRNKFLEQFPGSRFYVVFFPHTYEQERLKGMLADLEVDIIDLTELYSGKDRHAFMDVHFLKDFHPRPIGHEKVARAIAEHLAAEPPAAPAE